MKAALLRNVVAKPGFAGAERGLLSAIGQVAAGHQVSGITRSSRGADRIAEAGGSAVTVDIMDRDALLRSVDGQQFDAIIHEATALTKAPARHGDMAQTNALRTEGNAHLISAAEATGARRFLRVWISPE